jgi:hypothetical protein
MTLARNIGPSWPAWQWPEAAPVFVPAMVWLIAAAMNAAFSRSFHRAGDDDVLWSAATLATTDALQSPEIAGVV